MIQRRSAAPDIAGCVLLLFAATLFFALLRAFYAPSVSAAAPLLAAYGGLFFACSAGALGVFERKGWSLLVGLSLFVLALLSGIFAFHVPETAQLPAGILSLFGMVLLLSTTSEFSSGESASDQEISPTDRRDND